MQSRTAHKLKSVALCGVVDPRLVQEDGLRLSLGHTEGIRRVLDSLALSLVSLRLRASSTVTSCRVGPRSVRRVDKNGHGTDPRAPARGRAGPDRRPIDYRIVSRSLSLCAHELLAQCAVPCSKSNGSDIKSKDPALHMGLSL